MGGSWFSQVYGDPDSVKLEDLVRIAVKTASKQLGIKDNPVSVGVAVHKVLKNAGYKTNEFNKLHLLFNIFTRYIIIWFR